MVRSKANAPYALKVNRREGSVGVTKITLNDVDPSRPGTALAKARTGLCNGRARARHCIDPSLPDPFAWHFSRNRDNPALKYLQLLKK